MSRSFLLRALSATFFLAVNSGRAQNWMMSTAPNASWKGVAVSADGRKLVAAAGGSLLGQIYLSNNSGATWTVSSAPFMRWQGVAFSTDGSKVVAVTQGGIYTSTNSGTTWITNKQVLQNPDLTSTHWLAVTNAPDVTNGFNQVLVSPATGNLFFRLKQ
jgi:DNA-binding beta-propeller fold protein YncE